jgi:hypothetical protein
MVNFQAMIIRTKSFKKEFSFLKQYTAMPAYFNFTLVKKTMVPLFERKSAPALRKAFSLKNDECVYYILSEWVENLLTALYFVYAVPEATNERSKRDILALAPLGLVGSIKLDTLLEERSHE